MTDLATIPTEELTADAYPAGMINRYTTEELDQIAKVQDCAAAADKARIIMRSAIVTLKLMLDGEDVDEGVPGYNIHHTSRFWEGARNGDFGGYLREMAEKGDRKSVHRWVAATEAASRLLSSSVAFATLETPLLLQAQEQGLNQSTLEKYHRLTEEHKETADLYFSVHGTLKGDFIQSIVTLHSDYPELVNDFRQAILDGTCKYRDDTRMLMQEEDCRRSARAALMQREQHAEAMEKAEKLEAEAATYKSAVVSEPTVGDKAKPEEEILRKETPSKRWYKSENGQRAVEKVVGDLAEPLPDLLSSLVRLNRQMEDQAELMGQMRNYVQFWAGYDKFALAPSTSKKVWGSKGRLERMRALSSIMKELTQRLDIYIDVTTPDEDMEYPEE